MIKISYINPQSLSFVLFLPKDSDFQHADLIILSPYQKKLYLVKVTRYLTTNPPSDKSFVDEVNMLQKNDNAKVSVIAKACVEIHKEFQGFQSQVILICSKFNKRNQLEQLQDIVHNIHEYSLVFPLLSDGRGLRKLIGY